MGMIRILIAEDSLTVQRTLVALLEHEKDIEIVGVANNGLEAVEMCRQFKPDLVTMDIFMPEMSGLEATRKIMAECPTRIVIISSMVGSRDVVFSFEAMRAGAVEIIEKPGGVLTGNYAGVRQSLVKIIRDISSANLGAQLNWLPSLPPPPVGSSDLADQIRARSIGGTKETILQKTLNLSSFSPELICIGGSTGAPAVLAEILSKLPADYPYPIVIAQHISQGFAKGMSNWLDDTVSLNVKLADRRSTLVPGTVYVGPDDHHMVFTGKGQLTFIEPAGSHDYIPSVNHLFSTAAHAYGAGAVGILLSGMGRDGADGLLEIKKREGLTLIQNEDTCVIYGMPKIAAELGAAMGSMCPTDLASTLLQLI